MCSDDTEYPPVQYAIFVCEHCRDNPDDESGCSDDCALEWAAELWPLEDEVDWPMCKCCGRAAFLIEPLLRVRA